METNQGDRHRRGEARAIGRVARGGPAAVIAGGIAGGIAGWERERMLPRLVAVGPEELADDGRSGRLTILRRILSALRGERARGRAGHWSYSLDRHIGLVQALAAERRALAALDRDDDRSRGRATEPRPTDATTAADVGPRRS